MSGIRSECRGCKRVFAGMAAFDKHRIGSFCVQVTRGKTTHYYPGDRRCMTEFEIINAGLVNKEGLWGFPETEESQMYFEKLRTAREG